MSRKLVIDTCETCPHKKEQRVYTGDSWDNLYDIICGLKKDKLIFCQDTFDKYPKIPAWCPLPKD